MDKTEHQGAINLTSVRESTESLQNGEILRNGDMTEESQVLDLFFTILFLHPESLMFI